MRSIKEISAHLFLAFVALPLFVYFDSAEISLNKIKELIPKNSKIYEISNPGEPFTFLINYNQTRDEKNILNEDKEGNGILEGGGDYGQGFEFILKDVYPDTIKKVSLTAELKRDDDTPCQLLFVISIENKTGESVYWDAIYTSEIDFPVNSWKKITGEKVIPASAYDPENKLKIYPWNKGSSAFSIDNFKIVIGDQEERRGKKVLIDLIEKNTRPAPSVTTRYDFTEADLVSSRLTVLNSLSNTFQTVKGNDVSYYDLTQKKHFKSTNGGKFSIQSLADIISSSPAGSISTTTDGRSVLIIYDVKTDLVKVHEGEFPYKRINERKTGIQLSGGDSILGQFLITNATGQNIHVVQTSGGSIYYGNCFPGETLPYKKYDINNLTNGEPVVILPVIDVYSQNVSGLAIPLKSSETLAILTPDSKDFTKNILKYEEGLEFTTGTILFKTNNQDFILFNNEWRFHLRKIRIENKTIYAGERIELQSGPDKVNAKHYESQAVSITKHSASELMITITCVNKPSGKSEYDFKNKVEQFRLKL